MPPRRSTQGVDNGKGDGKGNGKGKGDEGEGKGKGKGKGKGCKGHGKGVFCPGGMCEAWVSLMCCRLLCPPQSLRMLPLNFFQRVSNGERFRCE